MKINGSEKPLLLGIILSVFILFILFSVSKKPPSQWQRVSLPDISNQPLQIRVAHAINSRFQSLNVEQLSRVLEYTRYLVKQHIYLNRWCRHADI